MIAGIASYVKALTLFDVIGVEPFEADAMYQSLTGRRVALDRVGIFADGVAVQEVGRLTFPIVQATVREVVRVSNDEICARSRTYSTTPDRSWNRPARWRSRTAHMGRAHWHHERAAGGNPQRRQYELRSA